MPSLDDLHALVNQLSGEIDELQEAVNAAEAEIFSAHDALSYWQGELDSLREKYGFLNSWRSDVISSIETYDSNQD